MISEFRPQIRVRVSAAAGAGKSTLIMMLRNFLLSQEVPVVMPTRCERRHDAAYEQCVDSLRRRGTIVAISEHDSGDETPYDEIRRLRAEIAERRARIEQLTCGI